MIVESFQKSVLCARSWPIASDGKCAFMDLLVSLKLKSPIPRRCLQNLCDVKGLNLFKCVLIPTRLQRHNGQLTK